MIRTTKHTIAMVLLLAPLTVTPAAEEARPGAGKIDRYALVTRHNVALDQLDRKQ
jgi:hypothetical protein